MNTFCHNVPHCIEVGADCRFVEKEFVEYINDLINYGISDFTARYRGESEDSFLMWQDYRVDQVQLKILNNPGDIMKGTFYKDGNMYVFAGLKKDRAEDDPLNYKDKFLSSDVFQWESIADVSEILRVTVSTRKNTPNPYWVLKILGEAEVSRRINN